MSEKVKAKWDLSRFIKTLVDFEIVPLIGFFRKKMQYTNPNQNFIFDFTNPNISNLSLWSALDDVVMGGVSRSQFLGSIEGALFAGDVSTANSGGFASIRTRNIIPSLDLSKYKGIQLQVKGDGNRYKFIVRDQDSWDSVGYCYSFDTIKNQWITVTVLFSSLIPVFRAKTIADGAPLNTTEITSLQLMLSKFEYDGKLNPHFTTGNFNLIIRSIKVII